MGKHVRTLLVDNYDSYTFNLFQLLAKVNGVNPIVIQNDDYDSWVDLVAAIPLKHFDNVVISPGPGTPSTPDDIGVCLDIMRHCPLPVLGVCLGHQALALLHGGVVVQADEPMHGRLSQVFHRKSGAGETPTLMEGVPSPFEVVRYHSLVVQENTLPSCLRVTARTSDGTIMSLQHTELPQWGVQFHPESIETQFGEELIRNFMTATWDFLQTEWSSDVSDRPRRRLVEAQFGSSQFSLSSLEPASQTTTRSPSIMVHRMAGATPNPTQLFEGLFVCDSALEKNHGVHFWLDSAVCDTSRAAPLVAPGSSAVPRTRAGSASSSSLSPQRSTTNGSQTFDKRRARFSYMGDVAGHNAEFLEFFVDPSTRRCDRKEMDHHTLAVSHTLKRYKRQGGSFVAEEPTHETNIFDVLKDELVGMKGNVTLLDLDGHAVEDLPFEFRCGYVGYLGYGLRNLCSVKSCGVTEDAEGKFTPQRHATPPSSSTKHQINNNDQHLPDSSFIFADRVVVVDHECGDVYLMALAWTDNAEAGDDASKAEWDAQRSWVEETRAHITSLLEQADEPSDNEVAALHGYSTVDEREYSTIDEREYSTVDERDPAKRFEFSADCTKQEYMNHVQRSIDEIRLGETYEVCLTNQLFSDAVVEPFELYKTLRTVNPAPFAAYLSMDPAGVLRASQAGGQEASVESSGGRSSAFAICCSSPERFLRVSKTGVVQSKPIKGTVRRGTTEQEDAELAHKLRTSVKDRAENLMIVDLVRNDLGRVCDVGSICVPKLMQIESYATVHQLVSTVQGQIIDTEAAKATTVDAIRAAFPGGSMTGAPKLRTMQIIDDLEVSERGIYSGSLGYISVDGASDFNIVIRTAVVTPGGVSVGTGGAIVALSDPEDEYNEMLLKSKALNRALGETLRRPGAC